MTAEFQYDVFLSHNQADKPRGRRLAERSRQSYFALRTSAFALLNTVLFRDPANAGRRFLPLPPDKSLTCRQKIGEYVYYGNSSSQ